MLGFCCNAGPAFLFGMLAPLFVESKVLWVLWSIHITSALLAGFLLPGGSNDSVKIPTVIPLSISESLAKAVKTTGLVCGWVITFRVLLGFCEQWVLRVLPSTIGILLSGILELSNGCLRLAEIESESLRFIIASSLLSFGGLCVTLQTYSVTASIPKKLYFPGKLLNCSISMVISCLVHPLIPSSVPCHIRPMLFAAVIIGIYSIVTLNYYQKYSRNLCLSGV